MNIRVGVWYQTAKAWGSRVAGQPPFAQRRQREREAERGWRAAGFAMDAPSSIWNASRSKSMIVCCGLPGAKASRVPARSGDRAKPGLDVDEAMPPNDNCTSDFPVRLADEDRKRKTDQSGPGTAVITKTKPQTKRPNLYRVLLLNDDYTPMEFVVHVLERFFSKDSETAHRIMMHVHQHGIGECGVFTYEVAETKVTQVMDFARKHQHPLQCIMEKK